MTIDDFERTRVFKFLLWVTYPFYKWKQEIHWILVKNQTMKREE